MPVVNLVKSDNDYRDAVLKTVYRDMLITTIECIPTWFQRVNIPVPVPMLVSLDEQKKNAVYICQAIAFGNGAAVTQLYVHH